MKRLGHSETARPFHIHIKIMQLPGNQQDRLDFRVELSSSIPKKPSLLRILRLFLGSENTSFSVESNATEAKINFSSCIIKKEVLHEI